ncbi:MAG: hypothetical protein UMU04_08635 [Halanaerobiales bacterium]|nr:hypothetical protein [Halanaerobiales bacterium]
MSYYKSREELFSYFNKHSAEKKDELDRHKTRSPLLKSYIIETSSVNHKKDFFDEINNHYDLSELKGDIIEIDDDQEDDKPAAWIEENEILAGSKFDLYAQNPCKKWWGN